MDARAAYAGLLILLSGGCRDEPSTQPAGNLVTADACQIVRLSQTDLQQNITQAEHGDRSAENRLWSHYSCIDKAKAAYWEERLVQAGDADAMSYRSSVLFSEAYDLDYRDPKKLTLLKQSLDLEARARKARDGRVLHVMVNGKYIDIRQSSEPDEGTRRMRAMLARTEAAQRK